MMFARNRAGEFRSCRGRREWLYPALPCSLGRVCATPSVLVCPDAVDDAANKGKGRGGGGKRGEPVDARQAGATRTASRRSGAASRRLILLAVVCAAPSGCAGFWDDITSRDFHFKDMFKPAPDPLEVIRTSPDGDKRRKALLALREPLRHGGTQQEQDVVVKTLTWSATNDPQPLCRMAAIDSLQHFKDPRAAQALIDAFYRAEFFQRDRPETMAVIRCQALSALGVNGNPAGVDLLIGIVKAPPTGGPNKDQQQDMDQRIAAARALAHFPQYQAAEALVSVLRTERDSVALRNRAHESLQEMTGEKLPLDAQAWADFLHQSGNADALVKKRSLTDKLLKLVSFSSDAKKPSDTTGQKSGVDAQPGIDTKPGVDTPGTQPSGTRTPGT